MATEGVVAFLASREFGVNFFANLGGAMVGVLLAFWIARVRARCDARLLYGRMLQTSRFELAQAPDCAETALLCGFRAVGLRFENVAGDCLVERKGIEPSTSALRTQRSPS